jgi:hypothetical protein
MWVTIEAADRGGRMEPSEYATNFVSRRLIYGLIMFAAVSLGTLITSQLAKQQVKLPVAITSPLLIYAALFLVWDKFLWRVASRLRYPLPDLNGTWTGNYRLATNPDQALRCTMKIRQTWAHMEVWFESDVGFSYSTVVSLNNGSGSPRHLCHVYKMEPKKPTQRGKHGGPNVEAHEGVARLSPQRSGWTDLRGYFYGKLEHNGQGTISLHRDSDKVPASPDRRRVEDSELPQT